MRCIDAHDLPVVFLNAFTQRPELGHQSEHLRAEAFSDHFIRCDRFRLLDGFEPFFNGFRIAAVAVGIEVSNGGET